jgi:hypothetical protein
MPHDSLELSPLPENPDALIPATQISRSLPIASQTASRWRHEGKGPRYLSIAGKRLVAMQVSPVIIPEIGTSNA